MIIYKNIKYLQIFEIYKFNYKHFYVKIPTSHDNGSRVEQKMHCLWRVQTAK